MINRLVSRKGELLVVAQFYFKYGAMNSGKSIEIIKVAHNYEEQNKAVKIYTSAVDDRSGAGIISSRAGFEREAVSVHDTDNLFEMIAKAADQETLFCILIDEAQFLKKHHIIELARVVDDLNIPVMAFGLKNDFSNELFEGSKYLLIYADKIEEIKTICWFCHKKATMNLRFHEGKPVYQGEQIQIGGNESYLPVCRRCYRNPGAL